MSNVVQLSFPPRSQSKAATQAALLHLFASHRRSQDDVFWMKENAEILNILECSGQEVAEGALTPHEEFYATIEERFEFFPQYYRFFLSICLDLEDLGLPGSKGAALVAWAARQGLADAELSDLQRGEARRLMLRRGIDPMSHDPGLDDRLRAFVERPATFVMPNKKAAYELTHTVFYLSEYGRKSPELTGRTKECLNFAGTLAYLDGNADLLAEICVAMRFAGFPPPVAWEDWLTGETNGFTVQKGDGDMAQDDYHEYLVGNWSLAARGETPFPHSVPDGYARFVARPRFQAPLRPMSETLLNLGAARSDDWARMRDRMINDLPEESRPQLLSAEVACDDFETFFAGFARTGLRRLA
ncbi:DUF6902 family protein [Pseudooceanicola aestuarii]|uniref:DUF6902 family protein n=1 Tax=Pseudooceanicola aestuarii TaxID=2697319 RepID=UPI0013D29BC0|nr:hypothetical protein [Pseudooceanicola aestuarii]